MSKTRRPTLASIRFGNYKCFATEQTLELRPLTILLGRNSSGKSAAARLPLLLAAGMTPRARQPLDLRARGLDFGDSFLDLVSGRRAHSSLDFGLRFQSDTREWSLDISVLGVARAGGGGAHLPAQLVQRWRVESGQDSLGLEWAGGGGSESNFKLKSTLEGGSQQSGSGEVRFAGLMPDLLSASQEPVAAFFSRHRELLQATTSLCDRIAYLGPFRARPMRYYRIPGSAMHDIGDEGENAPGVLAADREMGDGRLFSDVAAWFEKHYDAGLEIRQFVAPETSGATFSLLVSSPGRSDSAVALPDVGAGIAQVLPVVVQHYLSATTVDDEHARDLFICEQPELHLHPAAHAPLGDLFVEMARSARQKALVETHSENLILRVRRRVAEGSIDPNSIALYWVSDDDESGSTLRRLQIERDGWVEGWPEGGLRRRRGGGTSPGPSGSPARTTRGRPSAGRGTGSGMRVSIDEEILNDASAARWLSQILALFEDNRHMWIVESPEAVLRSAWLQGEGLGVQRRIRTQMEHAESSIPGRRAVHCQILRVSRRLSLSAAEWRVPPRQAAEYLSLPVTVLVENLDCDGTFLQAVMMRFAEKKWGWLGHEELDELRGRWKTPLGDGWFFRIEHGGGSNLDANLPHYFNNGSCKGLPPRLLILVDSDTLAPAQDGDGAAAPPREGTTAHKCWMHCCQWKDHFFQGYRPALLVLCKREVENYLPLPALERKASSAKRPQYHAFERLGELQKDHYDLKEGLRSSLVILKDEALPDDVATWQWKDHHAVHRDLFSDVEEVDMMSLRDGFGKHVWEGFGLDNTLVNRRTLRDRGGAELDYIVDQAMSLL